MIETERLLLRHLTEDDWPEYLAIHSDPEVMHYVGGQTDEAFLRDRFERMISDYPEGFGHFATVERASGRLLGGVGILNHPSWTATPYNFEVGWVIGKDFWGQGFATEAGRACIQYAFNTFDIERLICIVDPRNIASRRVAEKLGLDLTGETIWREMDVVWYETDPPDGSG